MISGYSPGISAKQRTRQFVSSEALRAKITVSEQLTPFALRNQRRAKSVRDEEELGKRYRQKSWRWG
jgi:hypothetical protein